MLAITFSIMFV